MFDTIQECVPDWNNSYIASNTTTENINDLLEYYGKLELQEAKRKPKTHRQDNTKSQQQPARNQNQHCQGNQNQRSGNNRRNEESFCSYHQLHGHSDAKCHDPHNPKGVNANNTHHNDQNTNCNRNHQQDHNYQNNQDSRNNQQHNHHYPTRSQQQREESHQQQEASDNRSQHTTNHSESNDEIFALEEKRNINTNNQNIITKQDYVLEIAIGVLADVVTKQYKYLQALIDSGSSSSIICESSMHDPIKKKIKDDPSGETKWTTKGGTYITTGEANIWFQLTKFAPSRLFKHKFKVDRDAKSASYNIILGRNAMKELQFDLLYSENIPKI
jgi:hypothetical protein